MISDEARDRLNQWYDLPGVDKVSGRSYRLNQYDVERTAPETEEDVPGAARDEEQGVQLDPSFNRTPSGVVRVFETGANRDVDTNKYDYEAFLSPLVIRAFGEYMHKNRQLKDGTLRPGDNWQLGIPKDAYMKSAWRHFHDVWMLHRGYDAWNQDSDYIDIKEALCALMFNIQGYLHSLCIEDL